MKLTELLCVAGIIGILASLLLTNMRVPDKLNGLRFSNHWRNYKIEMIMSKDCTQETLENLLQH